MPNIRILRGQINPNVTRKLVIDDGNFNHGFRITRFIVAGDPSGASQEIGVRLATSDEIGSQWDWGDQREVAWAAVRQTVEATWGGWSGAIDYSAIIVRDLFIDAKSSGVSTDRINYLIELEPIMLSDNEAVLALIKERNQSD